MHGAGATNNKLTPQNFALKADKNKFVPLFVTKNLKKRTIEWVRYTVPNGFICVKDGREYFRQTRALRRCFSYKKLIESFMAICLQSTVVAQFCGKRNNHREVFRW